MDVMRSLLPIGLASQTILPAGIYAAYLDTEWTAMVCLSMIYLMITSRILEQLRARRFRQ